MNEEQLSSEALRLLAAEDHAGALPLLEQLRDSAPDPLAKCIYLLNEARCFRSLRDYETAEQKLQLVEQLDVENHLRLHVENHRIDNLYEQKQYAEANARSKRLLRERAAELQDLQNADLLYQVRLGLGFGLVSEFEFRRRGRIII
jgi:tetratricopeptide (TPR) repeat protein